MTVLSIINGGRNRYGEDLINYTWKNFYKEALKLFIKVKKKNMTEEQVYAGKALLDKIKKLKEYIDNISNSTSIREIEFYGPDKRLDHFNYIFTNQEYINFKVIKTLILSSLNEELERCQKELNLL